MPTLPRVGTANLYHFLALCLLCKEWIRQNPHFLIVPCLHCKEWIRPIQSQETSTAPSLSGEWMRHFLNHYRLAPRPPFQTRVDAACSSQGQFDTASFCEAVYLNICQFVPSSVGGSRLFEHLLSTTPVCKEGCGRLIIIIAESTFCTFCTFCTVRQRVRSEYHRQEITSYASVRSRYASLSDLRSWPKPQKGSNHSGTLAKI